MAEVSSTARIKQMNLQLIRDALLSAATLTKKEIAVRTGLSLATCTVLLADLIAAGEVEELDPAQPQGGRPARRFCLNAHAAHLLCIRAEALLSGFALYAEVYDLKEHALLARSRRADDGEDAVALLTALIAAVLREDKRIRIIGVGVPGIVSQGAVDICDIPSLAYTPLRAHLTAAFSLPSLIGNDMYFTSYGCYFNQLRTDNQIHSLCVTAWPKGQFPGAGSIIDGHMITGASQFAGEISFLPLEISREEQLQALDDPARFPALAAKSLCAITALINPDVIVLCGERIRAADRAQLYRECARYIPAKHLPELRLCPDLSADYMKGIFALSRQALAYPLHLSSKN